MKKNVLFAVLFVSMVVIFGNNVSANTVPDFRTDMEAELEPKELKYFETIKAAADKYDVDASWLMAIIKVESDFNHKAVSSRGAVGLMQLMPNTAKSLGISDPYKPEKNIYAGAKYFARLVDTFGRMELALAAYNAGPTLVRRLRRVPYYKQTIFYVAKVLNYQKKYSHIMAAW